MHCDNFAKSTTVAVTPTQIDSDPISGGYAGGGQWVNNLLGNGMPGFCISTPTQSIRNQPVFDVGCMVSTGSGFAARLYASVSDSPKPGSQRWVDVLGDGTKAFCWESSDHPVVSCLPVDKDAQHFETPINSGQVQVGSYGQDETWWADVNGDGKADYCRAVVDDDENHITCTLMGQFGFGATFSTPPLKLGYEGTGAMVDIDGDGYADFCRLTKASNPADPTQPVQMSCLINDHENFLTSIDSSSPYNIELNLELTNPVGIRPEPVQTCLLYTSFSRKRSIAQ